MEDDRENQSRSQPRSSGKAGSGEGKLCIKLKIPNMEEGLVVVGEDHDDDQIGKPQRNDQPRVCNVCDKWFSSGKALGGHMRIHVQANKEESLKKLKTNHHQQPKKKDRPQLVVDLPEKTDTDNAGDSPTCSLCGKNFPSMKSLFGHMRCHPEREWRGIQPPPGAKNSSSSTTSSVSDTAAAAEPRKVNDDQIDSDGAVGIPEIELTKCLLPSWSVTARRGRRALVTASTSASVLPTTEEEEEKEKLNDAVQDLMRLAQGDSMESWPSGIIRVEESDSEATNSDSLTNKAEIEDMNWVLESKKQQKRPRIEEEEESPPVENAAKKLRIDERGSTGARAAKGMLVKILKKGKRKGVFEAKYDPRKTVGSGHEWVNVDDESDCKISDISTKPVTMIKSKKKRKKLKLTDLESVREVTAPADQVHTPIETTTPPPLDRYKCSSCDKSFPTHQALGGHRSSHNKVKTSPTIDDSSSPAAEPITRIDETKEDEGRRSGGDGDSSMAAEGIHHQCKICSKNFPTGQALGGHQRCHWNGTCPPPAEAPSSQPTSPGTGRKILGFDLNELPAMEDEESGSPAGGGGGYDCASSSRNSGSAA